MRSRRWCKKVYFPPRYTGTRTRASVAFQSHMYSHDTSCSRGRDQGRGQVDLREHYCRLSTGHEFLLARVIASLRVPQRAPSDEPSASCSLRDTHVHMLTSPHPI
eukprot:2858518-Pleurochrysis_carterae.AAC.1